MPLPTDTITVQAKTTYAQYCRLRHLAAAISGNGPATSVEDLATSVLQHLDEAICRPGSWERNAFAPLFGYQALAVAQEAAHAAGDGPR
jgi:hypothetical protein